MDESSLSTSFQKLAVPYFEHGISGFITAPDGIRIQYRYFRGTHSKKGTIVIANGRTEFMEKYSELVYDLKNSGYSIVLYDHRGQGASERLLTDPLRGYVAKSTDYVNDLSQLIEEVVKPESKGPLFILANSMGGAIATQYLIENPNTVSAFVAVSPMYAPGLKGIPQEVAFRIFEGVCFFNSKDIVYGQSYDPFTLNYETNSVTTSAGRFNYALELLKTHPSFAVGGPTNQWTLEAIRMGLDIKLKAAQLLTPTLIFQAGNELIVLPEAQNEIQSAAKDAQLLNVAGAKHELLMERDELRKPVLAKLVRFFDSYGHK